MEKSQNAVHGYDPLRTVSENLAFAGERARAAERSLDLCSSQLADLICRSAGTDTPEERFADFCAAFPDATGAQKADFCKKLAASQVIPSREELLGLNDHASPGSYGRISFVRNRYNDDAFRKFSEIVPSAKISHVSGFTEACEDVFNSRSEYCILPVENSTDGRLFVFYAMLDRYDLRICAVCGLETDGQSRDVCYALAGRTAPPKLPRTASAAFEFSLTWQDGAPLEQLLSAASAFGAVLRKTDTTPVEYDRNLFRYYFIFTLSTASVYHFAFFLSLAYPGYSLIGYYPLGER